MRAFLNSKYPSYKIKNIKNDFKFESNDFIKSANNKIIRKIQLLKSSTISEKNMKHLGTYKTKM